MISFRRVHIGLLSLVLLVATAAGAEDPPSGAVGTGFVVDPDGHIVTAHHVVEGASKIRVHFGDAVYEARLESASSLNDIALLKIDTATPNYLSLVARGTARLGQRVFTIGFPVPSLLGVEPRFTDGTLSALVGPGDEASLLQISVPVQPGNSGGPLLNASGEVVGVVVATSALKAFFDEAGTLPQNVNWAVKSEIVESLLKEPPTRWTAESEEGAIDRASQAVCLVEAEGATKAAEHRERTTPASANDIAVLHTSLGIVKIAFFPDAAPKAVENFIGLATKGYYDGITFHRVIDAFMIQGGDPTGTGRGGESMWGAMFADEISPELRFDRKGLLAMANKGPATNGSQFFITLVATPHLNGRHTIFGEVVAGMDVVQRIGRVNTGKFDKPVEPVTIDAITFEPPAH